MEERRFGEVHLTRHVLHPALVPRAGEDAHGGGVAAERPARERIHLHDPQTHVPKLACFRRNRCRHTSRSPSRTSWSDWPRVRSKPWTGAYVTTWVNPAC